MVLKHLHIINFKSIAAASLTFADKLNCFIGKNGMGKTNVLDAIHYLSFIRSHLGIQDKLAVRRGAEAAVLEGIYRGQGDERQLLLQIKPGHRKILKRNKKEYERLSLHIGAFPLVIISPQDHQLIQGTGEERRRFLDMQLSQEDPLYMASLSQYNTALEQRNSLLKSKVYNQDLLEVLDRQLSQHARYIWTKRRGLIERFIPLFTKYYTAIAVEPDEIGLLYESSLSDTEGELQPLLIASRERDHLLGFTTLGVHRDDLKMTLGGDQLKRTGSEGQRKTFLISLKLAQYRLLSDIVKVRPMLLLDDIFDKLDAERVGKIIELVGQDEFGQIFVTDTNRKYLDEIIATWGADYQLFSVDHGNIVAL